MNQEMRRLVSKRKLESLELIEQIEDILLAKRKKVFIMPAPGEPAVLAFSGGADSVCTTAILLEDYGIEVFPYYIKRGARAEKFEEKSVDFFSKYFYKRYPKLFHSPIKINIPIPAKEIKNDLPLKIRSGFGYPLRNSIIMSYGIQYAKSLEISQCQKVRTLFESIVASDADQTMHSTLTTLRSFNLHTCIDMGDWSWQISSIPLETELNNYFDKDILIKRAIELNLPIEKARTCIGSETLHCGECPSCVDRRRIFKELNIIDKTKYLNN